MPSCNKLRNAARKWIADTLIEHTSNTPEQCGAIAFELESQAWETGTPVERITDEIATDPQRYRFPALAETHPR